MIFASLAVGMIMSKRSFRFGKQRKKGDRAIFRIQNRLRPRHVAAGAVALVWPVPRAKQGRSCQRQLPPFARFSLLCGLLSYSFASYSLIDVYILICVTATRLLLCLFIYFLWLHIFLLLLPAHLLTNGYLPIYL